MPLTVTEARAELRDLVALPQAEVDAIFREMMGRASAEEVRDRLLDELPALGDDYFLQSASLAAEWYDDAREAAEVRHAFAAITADLPTEERWASLARWAVGPLFQPNPDPASALVLLQGGLQKAIADAHRGTIQRSVAYDRAAVGWARFGNGDTCRFCRMLISRGNVYRASTAKFGAHDHCSCVAGPVFDDVETVNGYITSPRKDMSGSEADADRAKAWMDENLPG